MTQESGISFASYGKDFQEKIDELGATIKFQMKKVLCLNVAIANCNQSADEIETNVVLATNFLASLLKKNWQNIASILLKMNLFETNVLKKEESLLKKTTNGVKLLNCLTKFFHSYS